MNLVRQGAHLWNVLDDEHRECVRCGLRLFKHARRGWVLVDFFGKPNDVALLGSGAGGDAWGVCNARRPPSPEDVVLIEYTGDPDVHPGCERRMHALVGSGGDARPACGVPLTFWEVGPLRAHPGWTWCPSCWVTDFAPHEVHAQALMSYFQLPGSFR